MRIVVGAKVEEPLDNNEVPGCLREDRDTLYAPKVRRQKRAVIDNVTMCQVKLRRCEYI